MAVSQVVSQAVSSYKLEAASRMLIQSLSPPLPSTASTASTAPQHGGSPHPSEDKRSSKAVAAGKGGEDAAAAAAAAAAERRRHSLAVMLPVAHELLQKADPSPPHAAKHPNVRTSKSNVMNRDSYRGNRGGLRHAGRSNIHSQLVKKWATELACLYQAPLVAYSLRKRRKSANTGCVNQGLMNQQGTKLQLREPWQAAVLSCDNASSLSEHEGDDVAASLRSYAVPVLLQCINVNPQVLEDSERKKLMEALLPEGERCWSL
jgi:hypothetical protein